MKEQTKKRIRLGLAITELVLQVVMVYTSYELYKLSKEN